MTLLAGSDHMRSAASLSPQGQAGRNAFQTLAVLESLLLTPMGHRPIYPSASSSGV